MSATTEASKVALPTGTWSVDPVHSSVEFSVRNMGIVNVKGHFSDFEGTLESTEEDAKTRGSVKVASVNTRSEKRDGHLLAGDFFDAESHPEITFESTRIEPDGDRLRVVGDLTIKGTTHEVELYATVEGETDDPWGGHRVGLSVTGEVDRHDYGLNWNVETPGGIALASAKVKIHLEIGAVQQS